jgi:Fe-S cluster assembly scaffold protein SufB
MTIQNIYNKSRNAFLFNDSKKFLNLREGILNSFDLSPKIKKNNESLKFLDPNTFEFLYKYKNLSNDIKHINHEENIININVIDGKISTVHKNNKKNADVLIKNINNSNDDVEKKFLYFQKYFKNDYVLNLNSLMTNSGYQIEVEEGVEANIFISNSISENNLTIFQKNLITCSKNSKIIIIEEFITDKSSNNNNVNFIDIAEGSEVIHLIFQKNNKKADLQSTSFTNCKEGSKYKQLVLNISQASIRNHHYANFLGINSSISLDGIFFGSNEQFIDNKTQVNHNYPHCVSNQRYKGILTDRAKASYLSKTFVDKIAQKTEAYQLSKGMLLSDNSYFHSKPELRIFADDVKCSHGSTIGPIDKELLFYLRSRGLTKNDSTSLLIKSFFHDIISESNNKNFIEKYNQHSSIWLKENNI